MVSVPNNMSCDATNARNSTSVRTAYTAAGSDFGMPRGVVGGGLGGLATCLSDQGVVDLQVAIHQTREAEPVDDAVTGRVPLLRQTLTIAQDSHDGLGQGIRVAGLEQGPHRLVNDLRQSADTARGYGDPTGHRLEGRDRTGLHERRDDRDLRRR